MTKVEIALLAITAIVLIAFAIDLACMIYYNSIVKRCTKQTLGVVKNFEEIMIASDKEPYTSPIVSIYAGDKVCNVSPHIDAKESEKLKLDEQLVVAYNPKNPIVCYVVNRYSFNYFGIKFLGILLGFLIVLDVVIHFVI